MSDTQMFSPVKVRRAFEAVCDSIRAQVANGSLKPGDRLAPDRVLAENFGVSRMAVREALRSLEMAGVVQAQAGVAGGFFICQGSAGGLSQAVHDMVALGGIPSADVTEARIHLTGIAIGLACERGTTEDFDAIEKDIERYVAVARTGQPLRDSSVITSFYHLLGQATHNQAVVMLIDALSEVVRNMLARIDPVPGEDVAKVRRKVLRHLRERDAARASAVLTRHLKALDSYIEERSAAVRR